MQSGTDLYSSPHYQQAKQHLRGQRNTIHVKVSVWNKQFSFTTRWEGTMQISDSILFLKTLFCEQKDTLLMFPHQKKSWRNWLLILEHVIWFQKKAWNLSKAVKQDAVHFSSFMFWIIQLGWCSWAKPENREMKKWNSVFLRQRHALSRNFDSFVVTYRVTNFLPKLMDMLLFSMEKTEFSFCEFPFFGYCRVLVMTMLLLKLNLALPNWCVFNVAIPRMTRRCLQNGLEMGLFLH